ncbi:MAG: hypothetical protein V2I33_26530 [Kangiellaceae bacterium]|jgi:hypothetical protein|nr:hypothetical protein [Kangiellaceae bacterium]
MDDPISLEDSDESQSVSAYFPDPEHSSECSDDDVEVLIVSVEIGDGLRDVIKVYEEDDAFKLAADFVAKHGLDPKLEGPLADHILENRKLLDEEMQSGAVGSRMFAADMDMLLGDRDTDPWAILADEPEDFRPAINAKSKAMMAGK